MSRPAGTKVGEDRFLERKDVVDSAAGCYFIYQREVVIEHYAVASHPETGIGTSGSGFQPEHVSWNRDPETTQDFVTSANAGCNPVTQLGQKTHQVVSRGSWVRYGPFTQFAPTPSSSSS